MELGLDQIKGDLIKAATLAFGQGKELGHKRFRQLQGDAARHPLGIETPRIRWGWVLRHGRGGIAACPQTKMMIPGGNTIKVRGCG